MFPDLTDLMVVVKFISDVKDSVKMISSVWRLEGLGHWVTGKIKNN